MSLNLDTETVFVTLHVHLMNGDICLQQIPNTFFYEEPWYMCNRSILVFSQNFGDGTQGSWKIDQLPKSLVLKCRCIMIVMGWMTFWKIGELTFLSAIHIVSISICGDCQFQINGNWWLEFDFQNFDIPQKWISSEILRNCFCQTSL